jgi:hypothetical protein
MRKRWIFLAPAAIVGIFLFIAIGAGVVQLLWNWLLPQLFGWPEITLWQALGLLVLCRILFGGFGRQGCHRSGSRMTAEERERFRQRFRERFGLRPSPGESQGQ